MEPKPETEAKPATETKPEAKAKPEAKPIPEMEAKVIDSIAERFPAAEKDRATAATRRVYLGVPGDVFLDALRFAREELGFEHLCTITGVDTGEHYEFIYHISNSDGILLNLKYKTGREDPVVIPSVLPIYAGATFYERELEGLLGVRVEGLPEGRQYPLPDNWPAGEYPMRKGWTPPKPGVGHGPSKEPVVEHDE